MRQVVLKTKIFFFEQVNFSIKHNGFYLIVIIANEIFLFETQFFYLKRKNDENF